MADLQTDIYDYLIRKQVGIIKYSNSENKIFKEIFDKVFDKLNTQAIDFYSNKNLVHSRKILTDIINKSITEILERYQSSSTELATIEHESYAKNIQKTTPVSIELNLATETRLKAIINKPFQGKTFKSHLSKFKTETVDGILSSLQNMELTTTSGLNI